MGRSLKLAGRLAKVWTGLEGKRDIGAEIAEALGSGLDSATSMALLGMGRDVPDGRLRLSRHGTLDVDWTLLSRSGLLGRVVDLFHRECDVPACHMLSMMWGAGWPALHHHENLHDVTHRRGGDLYGATSVHYYRHVRKMVEAGGSVKYDPSDPRFDHLPDDYLAFAADVETPVLLVTGENNHVFTDSNIVCYERLESLAPGRHALEVIPGYGHQDVFMGKDCARDVFPRFLRFLNAQRRGLAAGRSQTTRWARGAEQGIEGVL
jgi:hypothetical protein